MEKLVCVGILREGKYYGNINAPCFEHWRLRHNMGDETPSRSDMRDTEGFWTNLGRFVNRREATTIAYNAGQTDMRSGLLRSSMVDTW